MGIALSSLVRRRRSDPGSSLVASDQIRRSRARIYADVLEWMKSVSELERGAKCAPVVAAEKRERIVREMYPMAARLERHGSARVRRLFEEIADSVVECRPAPTETVVSISTAMAEEVDPPRFDLVRRDSRPMRWRARLAR